MARRLVVLGCGLVGGAIAELAATDCDHVFDDVIAVGRSIPKRIAANTAITSVFGAVGDGSAVKNLQPGDTVVAAYGPARPRLTVGEAGPVLAPAGAATGELLDALTRLDDVHLMLVSSGGAVYGARTEPFSEADPLAPSSAYGALKAGEELVFRLLNELAGRRATVLRASTVYGIREHGNQSQGLVQLALDRIRAGETIDIFGDGSSRRGYLLDRDFARVVLTMAARGESEHNVYNVCSGQVHTTSEVIDAVAASLGIAPRCRFLDGVAPDVVLSVDRLVGEFPDLGFASLVEGVTRLVAQQ